MTSRKKKAEFEELTLLGGEGGRVKPSRKLETFPNQHPHRDYVVTLETDEFTCVCPMTGQPDFARIKIQYAPEKRIVESKSLKLYLWSYRDEGAFHEHVANRILDDLVAVLAPRWCNLTAEFAVRGGISITIAAAYQKP
jgi:7-cyano-7-deazaguanine reductase